jgi:hypothetical protein
MIWLLFLVAAVVFGPYVILWFRYIVAINFERGGWWNLLVPMAIKTGAVDIFLNYTSFRVLMWSKPGPGEYTISKHLERLVLLQTRKGAFCRHISKYFINPWDKVGGPHIPIPDNNLQ